MATLVHETSRGSRAAASLVDGFEAAWADIRQQLLRYIEARAQECAPTGHRPRRGDFNPTRYQDGQRAAYEEALTALGEADSFTAVFLTGRALKRKLAEAHRVVAYSESRLRERYEDVGPVPSEDDDAMTVVTAMDYHLGRRDALAGVVQIVAEVYQL